MKEKIWYLSVCQYMGGLDTERANFFVFSLETTERRVYVQ